MNNVDHIQSVTITTEISKPVEKVWKFWTAPEHIIQWNNASEDWHTSKAENDLKKGGKFVFRMESKDGSMGFDFDGVYTEVIPLQLLAYTMGDGRKAKITFSSTDGSTEIEETFETESMHTIEQQREGWQAILNNFKKYTEGN